MAFFLLSGPGARPTGPESEAPIERVYGISGGPGCCTLLLYSAPNLGS